MKSVTIGFIPRDRFCRAAESLKRLFDFTKVPFKLFVVDSGIPRIFRQQMDDVLAQRSNVEVVQGTGMSSNECRNLVLNHANDDYLCLIENDVMVEQSWLQLLLNACEEYEADVGVPLLLEPFGNGVRPHFDWRLGRIQLLEDGHLMILPGAMLEDPGPEATPEPVHFIEMHCKLFKRAVFDRIGPFDSTIGGSRAEVDLSLALHHHEVPVILEPNCHVLFSSPPPVYAEERAHYMRYWSLEQSKRDHIWIEKKWKLVECPSALGFCRARLKLPDETSPERQVQHHHEWVERLRLTERDLANTIPEDATMILVDDVQWNVDLVAPRRKVIPFLERNGQYAGVPPDSHVAIHELRRLVGQGAQFLVFGWPGFWWLDHYVQFRDYLYAEFTRVLENDRLLIFDMGVPDGTSERSFI